VKSQPPRSAPSRRASSRRARRKETRAREALGELRAQQRRALERRAVQPQPRQRATLEDGSVEPGVGEVRVGEVTADEPRPGGERAASRETREVHLAERGGAELDAVEARQPARPRHGDATQGAPGDEVQTHRIRAAQYATGWRLGVGQGLDGGELGGEGQELDGEVSLPCESRGRVHEPPRRTRDEGAPFTQRFRRQTLQRFELAQGRVYGRCGAGPVAARERGDARRRGARALHEGREGSAHRGAAVS
jgi:hypothetical protein